MLRAICMLALAACIACVDAAAAVPRAQEIERTLALPDDLGRMLPAAVRDRSRDDLERMQALVDFMIADDGLALRYLEQPTLGIDESFARRQVNCLSFTMMFVAMARAVGIDAFAQASDDALAIRVIDDTLYRATHVNAGVQIGHARHTVDVGWRAILAGREPRRIDDARLVAMLHNNHAVESLLRGEPEAASASIAAALALDPANPTVWSNAGVVHWRAGRNGEAERAYLRALALRRDHVGALSNMVALQRVAGSAARLAVFEKRLQRAQAGDPFSQFVIAQSLAGTGRDDEAVAHYLRAIRLLPGEPRFHRSLAEVYQRQGKASASERARQRAERLEARQASRRGIREAATATPEPG